jgi:MFS family permease
LVSNLRARLKAEFAFVRGNLLFLILSYVVFRFASSLHSSFSSLYIRELGATPFLLGLMSSVGSAIYALIRIPGSFIANKYGRRTIIVIFTYGVALSYLFYVFAVDWRFVMVGMVILNLCHMYIPALEAIEADSIPSERRGMGYAAINVFPMILAIFAPPIGGFLVERLGLVPGMRIVYAIVVMGGLMSATIRTLFLKETLVNPERIRLQELRSAFKESVRSIAEAWRYMSKGVVFFTIVMLISAFEAPLFELFMALYANDVVGVSGLQWSLMGTVWMVTTLFVGMPLGRMIDTVGRKKSILLAYLFSTPIILFFILSRGFIQLLIVHILSAVGQAVMWPALYALQADLVPQDKRGRIMGIIGTLRTLAMVPASTIFGLLYQSNPATPFILAILLETIIVAIVVFGIHEHQEKEN